MPSLECSLCGRPADDLAADVVADRDDLVAPTAGPGRLRVVCHDCLADPSTSGRYQTMWGLGWLRSHYLVVTRGLLADMAAGPPGNWRREAVEDFVGLGYLLLPGQERPDRGTGG